MVRFQLWPVDQSQNHLGPTQDMQTPGALGSLAKSGLLWAGPGYLIFYTSSPVILMRVKVCKPQILKRQR